MITNLDRLEELLSKATPTPWGMVTHMGIPGEGTVYGIRFDVGYSAEGLGQHESRLIAEAMNALPDLIAELREQATIIDKLKAELVDERAARSFQGGRKMKPYEFYGLPAFLGGLLCGTVIGFAFGGIMVGDRK